jgi:sugar O-acyltransferase (sialic acid O-acetyltransferase NeuD family)
MKIVIFGNGKFASLAWYCLTNDSAYEVAGFTVDTPYLDGDKLHGLPVADFATVEIVFPPETHAMLVHVGGVDMNAVRIDRCASAKVKGYVLGRYVSSRALTWPDIQVGNNSVIYEGAIVQPFATIGDNVIVRSGAHISHHALVEDDCFIAAGACLGGGAIIGRRSFVGLNATIRDGVRIAEQCLIGAGAVVTGDTEPDGVYVGVPARRTATPASQISRI